MLCSNKLYSLKGLSYTMENEAEASYPISGESPVDNLSELDRR
jgi:hypothetical protein